MASFLDRVAEGIETWSRNREQDRRESRLSLENPRQIIKFGASVAQFERTRNGNLRFTWRQGEQGDRIFIYPPGASGYEYGAGNVLEFSPEQLPPRLVLLGTIKRCRRVQSEVLEYTFVNDKREYQAQRERVLVVQALKTTLREWLGSQEITGWPGGEIKTLYNAVLWLAKNTGLAWLALKVPTAETKNIWQLERVGYNTPPAELFKEICMSIARRMLSKRKHTNNPLEIAIGPAVEGWIGKADVLVCHPSLCGGKRGQFAKIVFSNSDLTTATLVPVHNANIGIVREGTWERVAADGSELIQGAAMLLGSFPALWTDFPPLPLLVTYPEQIVYFPPGTEHTNYRTGDKFTLPWDTFPSGRLVVGEGGLIPIADSDPEPGTLYDPIPLQATIFHHVGINEVHVVNTTPVQFVHLGPEVLRQGKAMTLKKEGDQAIVSNHFRTIRITHRGSRGFEIEILETVPEEFNPAQDTLS